MSMRFRRSLNLGGGTRINLSKRGIGLSVGPRGARYSVHSAGRTVRSVGVPGTGIFWRKDTYARSSRSASRSGRTVPATPAGSGARRRPGLFAPRAEKHLHAAYTSDDPIPEDRIDELPAPYRQAARLLMGLLHFGRDDALAERLLRGAIAEREPAKSERFLRRYFGRRPVAVEAGLGIELRVPPSRDLALVLLAQLAEQAGDLRRALGWLEQLSPSPELALVHLDAANRAGDHERVLTATDGVRNDDDLTMALCTLRGIALRELGHHTASRAAFREALKSKKRNPTLRHITHLERARTYLAEGQRARARKDCERVLAEDSAFDGVQELLAEIDAR